MSNEWLCEVFRLTVFFQSARELDATIFWQQLTGNDPDKCNLRIKERILQDEGDYKVKIK